MDEMSNLELFMRVTPYDGCGKCLLAVRRLSRKSDATSSPERQAEQICEVCRSLGGHIVGWADDWEVSGATNPRDRPKLGPWLRGERGLFDGIVAASVDRIGRNMTDVLNTGWAMHDSGKLLLTHGHDGPWDLDDPTDENRFTVESWSAQMELRAIQKRARDDTKRARSSAEKKNAIAYGYRVVRLTPNGKIHRIELDPHSARVLREIATRLLSSTPENTISPATEARRLNQAGELSPRDYARVAYGREPKGTRWSGQAIKDMMLSEAALGYLMHEDRPVTREVVDQESGEKRMEKIRIADPIWDAATRAALIERLRPAYRIQRAPKSGGRLLTNRAFCGNCHRRLYQQGRPSTGYYWICNGRQQGLPESVDCKPAPTILMSKLDAMVTEHFLKEIGPSPQYRQAFDPGTGHAARRAELETDVTRLREDRAAGLYDRPEDAEWFRGEFQRLRQELDALNAQPERGAGMVWVPTGKTMAEVWHEASTVAARRELLESYHIKAVVYPRGAAQRVWIHNLDPGTEAESRQASWDAAQQEDDEQYQQWLAAQQDSQPDDEEYEQAAYPRPADDDDQDDEPEAPDDDDLAEQAEDEYRADQDAQDAADNDDYAIIQP